MSLALVDELVADDERTEEWGGRLPCKYFYVWLCGGICTTGIVALPEISVFVFFIVMFQVLYIKHHAWRGWYGRLPA